ncbi:hypothetical protein [Microbulbifer sp. M83]|uniref:hypothetical protein n=1 Tax=Microbulbifer sp. M83 TaxID=3118246 RepID=UPI002FE26C48
MKQVLISPTRGLDLAAREPKEPQRRIRHIAATLDASKFGRVELLSNYPAAAVEKHIKWLEAHSDTIISAPSLTFLTGKFRRDLRTQRENLERLRKITVPALAYTLFSLWSE